MNGNCPVCDRPPGDRRPYAGEELATCHMWGSIRYGCSASDFEECYRHARPWRLLAAQAATRAADLEHQLKVAQAALSRHHDAARPNHGTFRDGARIE